MTHLQTIRDRVIAAVPSILDLKFGCEFLLAKNGWTHKVCGYLVDENENYEKVISVDYMLLNGKYTSVGTHEIQEILGRPIRLADVLVALENKGYFIGDSIRKGYGCWLRFDPDGEAISCAEENSWNLLIDDLNLQSPETIEFLYNLLK